MPSRKNVFIIGNGFDLSLGLPTSYTDFIKSDIFKKHLDNSELFKHFYEKINIEKWVDIEAELVNISKKGNNNPKFLDDYKLLCRILCEYIESIGIENINRKSPAYELLRSHYNTSESYIANFNYTNTVQFILNELTISDVDITDSVHHIHGDCLSKNIVFGVNDNARIDANHVFLYKSTSNHDGGRGIKNALKAASRVFFFGHSLAESDRMYLVDFFRDLYVFENDIELHFFHYGETGYHDLHKSLHELTSNNVSELKSRNTFHVHDTSLAY